MLLYFEFPRWIKPQIFYFIELPQFLNFLYFIRWYGLMYIVAIAFAYLQSVYILKREKFRTLDRQKLDDFYFWGVVGLLLGGRIISCFVYDLQNTLKYPWQIFVPFRNLQWIDFPALGYYLVFFFAVLLWLAVFIHFRREMSYKKIKSTIFKSDLKKMTNRQHNRLIQNLYTHQDRFYILKQTAGEEEMSQIKTIFKHYKTRLYQVNRFLMVSITLIVLLRVLLCFAVRFDYYRAHLTQLFLPFKGGEFTGLAGMSVHGAVIGSAIAMFLFYYIKKVDIIELSGVVCTSVPLGYTFGRLGNFINSELYGRITAHPLGVIFPDDGYIKVPLKLKSTQDVIQKLGWTIEGDVVRDRTGKILEGLVGPQRFDSQILEAINLPRHPSQLYEAFLEGILLGCILWLIRLKFPALKKYCAPVFLGGYAVVRIAVEFLRQPDFQFANYDNDQFMGFIFGHITMGQILSVLMLAGALGLAFWYHHLSKKDQLKS